MHLNSLQMRIWVTNEVALIIREISNLMWNSKSTYNIEVEFLCLEEY